MTDLEARWRAKVTRRLLSDRDYRAAVRLLPVLAVTTGADGAAFRARDVIEHPDGGLHLVLDAIVNGGDDEHRARVLGALLGRLAYFAVNGYVVDDAGRENGCGLWTVTRSA